MNHQFPPGDGWAPWLDPDGRFAALGARLRPHSDPGALVEIWRAEWGNETQFLRPGEMHPAMNVAGLWWRAA